LSWERYFKEGNEYMEIKWYDMAMGCFKKALKDCPDDKKWMVYKKLGDCYLFNKKISIDIEFDYMYGTGLRPRVRTKLIGDYNKAIEYFEKALKCCPDKEKWKIFLNLGFCYRDLGLYYNSKRYYNKVIECYEEALKYCPDDKKWIINLL